MALFYGSGMTGDSAVRRFQCIPEYFGLDVSTKIFSETKDWKDCGPDNFQPVLALENKSTKETETMTEKKENSTTGNEVTEVELETPSDGVAVVHEGNPTIEYVGTKPIEIIMDAKDCRWGGWDGGLDAFTVYGGDLDPECPEVTLIDIYNMGPQDRIEWFFRYPQTAFGIFQDLVEQTIIEDSEVTHEGDEADEDEEESVDASRAAMMG
jgi:hypothetical protein